MFGILEEYSARPYILDRTTWGKEGLRKSDVLVHSGRCKQFQESHSHVVQLSTTENEVPARKFS